MDKFKSQLALVKQHSFWAMCVGILVVCLVSWFMSTKAINAERAKQLTDIKAVFDQLSSIQSTNPKHPNKEVVEGMDVLLKAKAQDVFDAWQTQYNHQSDVLVWPPSFREDAKFMTAVENKRPIEVVPFPTPITSDLDADSRRLYRDYIMTEIPHLAEIIGATFVARTAAGGAGGESGYGGYGSGNALGGGALGGALGGAGSAYGSGYGGSGYGGSGYGSGSGYPGGAAGSDGLMPNGPVEDKSIVMWSPTNQQELVNTHFGFVTREIPPTTLEVLYAQEDLWVLENLMQLIRATNGDATARHEATIKQIDFVRLGRSAFGMAGFITPVGAAATSGGMSGAMMGSSGMSGAMMGSSGMSASGSMSPSGGMDAASASADTATSGATSSGGMNFANATGTSMDPALGRYVDPTYAPLDPAKLRAAITSQSKDDALLVVAKRMPVRMRFRIDQRKMSKLLAECGNAKLPLEVRQVRLNRPPAPVGGMGSGYGGYGGDMASGYGGGSGYGGMPGLGGMADSSSESATYGGGSGYPGSSGYGGSGYPGSSGYGSSGYGSSGYPGSSGYGGSGYGSSGYGGAMGGAGLPGAAPRAVGGASSTAAVDYNQVDVELYGIVYIYNPPNRAQLGIEPTATPGAAPPAAPTTPPAATPTPTPVAEPAPATTPAPLTTPTSAPAPPATATTTPPAAIVPAVGTGS